MKVAIPERDRRAAPLIWINGAFGVGKSTVAEALRERLGDAAVFDPEPVGMFVWRLLPEPDQPDDFQHLALWRALTVQIATELVAHGRPVIVPMTVARPEQFDEIVGGLRTAGIDVRHVTLTADRGTIEGRLAERAKGGEPIDWALAQLDRCLAELPAPRYALHLATDSRPASELAAEIERLVSDPPVLRSATGDDLLFLAEMLAFASFPPWAVPTPAEALLWPHARRYLDGWWRPGDLGVIAEVAGHPVGAAWCRVLDEQPVAPGPIPELAIAIHHGFRGRGVGTALLDALMAAAAQAGFEAMCLRVNPANAPALALYARHGFRRYGGTDDHPTMLANLRA